MLIKFLRFLFSFGLVRTFLQCGSLALSLRFGVDWSLVVFVCGCGVVGCCLDMFGAVWSLLAVKDTCYV